MIAPTAKAYFFTLLMVEIFLLVACAAKTASDIPEDFTFVLDVRDAQRESANNIHITINSNGHGTFDEYNTNGSIQYDLNHIVTYSPDQVVRTGTFKLTQQQRKQLWDSINDNQFFEVAENSQIQLGYSYAFMMVTAGGKEHKVDNIGLEVPQIHAIVNMVSGMLPDGVDINYGEGYTFQK